MQRLKIGLSTAAIGTALLIFSGHLLQVQAGAQPQADKASAASAAPAAYVEWPLAEADRAYGVIDGHHIWQYVVEQVAISRHYRDQGHQLWGRIIGTSGDAESAQWLLDKFKQIGLTDTHIQPVDLQPQWMAQSWDVTVTAGGKTLSLATAQPAYLTPGTQGQGLDLEAVYVELGSEADYAGRDVRGKAVFISRARTKLLSALRRTAPEPGALMRAERKGAAAIFDVTEMAGNLKFQPYPTNTNVPTFCLGTEDGHAVRDLIEKAAGGQAPRVHVRIDVQTVPDLKTALVWGTLPGATDETIYVQAHRDGWFDAAGDNAGGVASMLGLAEYFAKIPKSQRRRTMVFIGLDGHHNLGGLGAAAGSEWLVAHRDQFYAKTALLINDEHPSNVETYMAGDKVGRADSYVPMQWYAGGPSRPELQELFAKTFREFGVPLFTEPSTIPPGGDLGRFYWFLPGVVAQSNDFFYFHTDANSPETIPWTGLQSVTRAYAKLIDEINKIDLKELQRPAGADTHRL